MKENCYKHYIFKGTHRKVGQDHGEALRYKIKEHIELTYELADKFSGVPREEVLSVTKKFEPFIEKYAPGFLDEIKGIGEGADITEEEAMLLQIRQEVVYLAKYSSMGRECTSYAIGGEYTKDGRVYSGQNADLSGDFESISNVITFEVKDKPKVMMLTPAGQISYLGINSEGMSVNCNFLPCNGWREGYPRYLISRLLLEKRTFEEACETMKSIKERASSRNVLLADYEGRIADFEVNTESMGCVESLDMFVHSNHFIDPYMKKYEKSTELEMIDSEWRRKRVTELINENRGRIDAEIIKSMLRDHKKDDAVGKFSICTHACKETDQYHTIASIINDLEKTTMEITRGLPCINQYKKYKL